MKIEFLTDLDGPKFNRLMDYLKEKDYTLYKRLLDTYFSNHSIIESWNCNKISVWNAESNLLQLCYEDDCIRKLVQNY